MDSAEILSGSEIGSRPGIEPCPRCGEPTAGDAAVASRSLDLEGVRRCARCGTRTGLSGDRRSLVFTCVSCGLPFACDDLLPHADYHCSSCREGGAPPDLPSADVTAAVEAEIRAALSTRWTFVRSDRVDAYVEPLARRIAGRVDADLRPPRVVLVDDDAVRSLALPSGLLLVSVGTLRFLEDEAELAFVLAHEIAHAACGDAAVRLVRLGFRAAQRGEPSAEGCSWGDAAEDLVRLGYGRHRERDADARALAAVVDLGYDTASVIRYFRRLEERVAAGDPRVVDTAVAHPTAADRIRRIERTLYGRIPGEDVSKVNREVFRRAVVADLARPLESTSLRSSDLRAEPSLGAARNAPRSRVAPIAIAAVLVVTAVAAAALALLSMTR